MRSIKYIRWEISKRKYVLEMEMDANYGNSDSTLVDACLFVSEDSKLFRHRGLFSDGWRTWYCEIKDEKCRRRFYGAIHGLKT